MTKINIWITSRFVGYHRWVDAPEDVAFLRDWHRHIFGVRLEKEVRHNNRDIEFFQLKRKVDYFLASVYQDKQFELSCEAIAEDLLNKFAAVAVEVDEDGENGARVEWTGDKRLTSLQAKTKCFLGLEVEGPNRGKRVLFVPGSIPPEQFLRSVEGRQFDRVFYGAGYDRQLRSDTLAAIRSQCPDRIIDVEVDAVTPLLDGMGVGIISLCQSDVGCAAFIKEITATEVIWTAADGTKHRSQLDDPWYELDEDI